MPEIPNVIPGEPVASEWGNDIRDRAVQRYASVANRNSLTPTPEPGEVSYLADSGAIEVYHSGAWRALIPAGVVMPYAGITPPTGFLICNGALISRATYAALFAAIGTTYGAGDGSTTFALPDLRQRFPMGVAASGVGSTLGQTGGAIDHVHSGPSHTHTGPSHTHTGAAHTHNIDPPAFNTSTVADHDHAVDVGSAGSHSHSFSDTSSGPSGTGALATGSVVAASTENHTHSVSGTTGSGGSHDHTADATPEGSHAHSVNMGTTPTGGASAASTGSSGTGATGAGGTGATGGANPPFMALHFIIRT